MSIEEQLEQAKKAVERKTKTKSFDKNRTQAKLAILIGESRAAVNKAIKGSTNPKSIKVRKKIYKALGMKQ